jgi:PAS domain S-box-containing protein
MRVLIADDSQPIRERLIERLSRLSGITVAVAVDTPDALRQMTIFDPDLAVLDVRMPGGGGIKVLGQIKKKKPETTVIMITNYPYAQYRRKCLEEGADFFFDKSTEFEQVAETIRQLMQTEKVSEVAQRTVAAQLVAATEEFEKTTQRRRDMSILSLLHKPKSEGQADQAYAMWEKTFDTIPDLVAIFDTNHCIVRVNKAMADRLGVSTAELAGKKCFEYCHGTACPIEGCPHEAMLKMRKEQSAELYEKNLGCWFEISVSPVFEKDLLIGAIHIAHDITARKEAEILVQQGERNLRHVIGAIRDGLWDWNIKTGDMKCSPQWYQMLGYEPDEFLVTYARFEKMIHPEDVSKVEKAVWNHFFGAAELYSVEFRLRRKDGTYVWVLERGSLIERNAAGEPSRMMGVHADITEERKASQALEASEIRYRQLFESMQAGFALHEIICNGKGIPCDYRFLEVNPAFETLADLKAEQMIGRTGKEVMPTREPSWIEMCGKVALTGVPLRIENFSGSLGRFYSVSVYSPRKGQFATVFIDITEQKNAEAVVLRARDVAEAASLEKTRFLANMSHELRTPLNAIIGFTDLLEFSKLDEEQLDYIKTIGDSGEVLLTLVSDLLDLSRIELGKLEIKNEPFSIRSVVKKSVSLLSSQAGKKGLELSASVDEKVPDTICGDADRLQQVLVNLFNNAVKFTDHGFVKLMVGSRISPSGRCHIEFAVEDSGEGMDASTMERIFEPFRQGDNSNTRAHGGAGLGLAISKNLVEMMGGRIRVESCKGNGTRFSFHIIDRTGPHPVSAGEVRDQWRGRYICVWDDDPADLRAVEHLLERCGIMPRYIESIDAINNRLNQDIPPDAVLCNLDMPGLAAQLPEFREIQADIPWIAFSNWNDPLDEKVKKCFSAFIDRPLNSDQLYDGLLKIATNKPRNS